MEVNPGIFAGLIGVTPAAVSKAARTGRLSKSVTRDDYGRVKKIDVVMGKKEWEANTDPSKVRKKKTPEEIAAEQTKEQERIAHQPALDLTEQPSLQTTRQNFEYYKAQNERLEYEERSGKLVRADDVKKEAFRLARGVRDSLMNIPDRLATELAGISDHHVIHQRISNELRAAIQGMMQDA